VTSMEGAQPHSTVHGSGFWDIMFSTDHKVIAKQYLFTGMAMAVVGGFLAYVLRMQLAYPGESVPGFGAVTPHAYNALVTNHGTIMIFWVAMPVLIAALGNFLIPLMLGCDDMVFPRLNRLSFQVFLLSAVIMVGSLLLAEGGFTGAWTAYPPLSTESVYSLQKWSPSLWLVAVALEIVAFLIGGINFIVTALNARAPGMTLWDLPIVIWMIVIACVLFMGSVGPLVAGAVMLLMDQLLSTGFYDPTRGGDPILWQHLFWFFGHPEVYVLLLPAFGVVVEIITVFSRKKLFGYKMIVWAAIVTTVLSFFVWAHHQFVAGIDPRMANVFSVTTLLISIPIAEMLFLMIATLYRGSIQFTVPMLWALSFLSAFLFGGVTGIFLGSSGSDIYLHDSYFVVSHFHYTVFPITILAGMAGLTFWFPKMFGRVLDPTLGKIHFWGTFVTFNMVFLPLMALGIAGQHRRIYDYKLFAELSTPMLQDLRVLATLSLVALIAVQLVLVINIIITLRRPIMTDPNPWRANTLEWAAASPPPHGNFPELPSVYRGPYEYSHPDREDDFWPQHLAPEEVA
jgi:cytochrome c oxidase subunit I